MSNNVLAPELTIRSSKLDDSECITGLMREICYPMTCGVMRERMEAIEGDAHAMMMIAELDGKVVGAVGAQIVQSHAYPEPAAQITLLIVCKENRGEGIGKRLVAFAEQWAREQGGNSLLVTGANRERNADALDFYEHIGFEKHGYRISKKLI